MDEKDKLDSIIEALRDMEKPMKDLGDALERYDEEEELPPPMEVFSHLRATGRGV